MDYREIYRDLGYHTAIIKFRKRDGEMRAMLCTRNEDTMRLLGEAVRLGGYDARCNVKNGNIAVVDLIIGEPRQFSVNRLEGVELFGEIDSLDKLGELVDRFEEEAKSVEKRALSLDDLD